jgi:glycosyltransferase involved in cell wall biosynthesis
MRVLILTKIFPNQLEPLSAPFNRRQFAALSRLCEVEVLATIPWFPGASAFGRWSSAGRLTTVPDHERIDGVAVEHPRFAFVPKVGQAVAGPLYVASLARAALSRRGRVDVVLGSWAYPDGFAAVVLAEMLGVPAVIKLHGSDMNVVARWRAPRRYLEWALPRAARVVAVSRQLATAAAALGAAPERIDVVPNGIDREVFMPRDRSDARAQLGLPQSGKVVLFVGHLTEPKGAGDLIRAFTLAGEALPDTRLVMVGDGSGSEACRALAANLGERVSFVGAEPHERIPLWLAACDVLALPSWNEGMPNVVLEALACGRAVVASNVGGIPDVVDGSPHELVPPRDPAALALALERVLRTGYEPSAVAARLSRPDWEGSARLLHQSLLSALGATASEAA